MKTIELMVGLPRSGKSTYVENNKEGKVVLSKNKLRLLTYNQRFWAEGEPMMKAVHSIMLRCLMEQGIDLIIDDTNFNTIIRKEFIKLAKRYGYKVIARVFMTSPSDCIQRAKDTNQEDLIHVIKNTSTALDYPVIEEGIDEIILHE
jgi:predicted kinase